MKETYEQLLNKMGVAPEALKKARKRQAERGGYLRENLIALGTFSEEIFSQKISELLRVPYVNLKQTTISDDVLGLLSHEQAEKYQAIPVESDEKHRRVSIAMADPADMSRLDELKFIVGHTLIPLFAPEDELAAAISRQYARLGDRIVVVAADAVQQVAVAESQRNIIEVRTLTASETKIVQLIGTIFSLAHARHASEIHIKPSIDGVYLCFRIHGKVSEIARFPRRFANPLISKMKRLLGCELGEHPRFFHKGSTLIKLKNKKELDCSYLIYPTASGEETLMKLKDRTVLPALENLTIDSSALNDLQRACDTPHGVVFVTGTARSGVTSMLYALLQTVNKPYLNICSIEDPVECFLENVVQGQVSDEAGQTYAEYVRYILEQRPNVVLIDKVFDAEMIQDLFHISYGSLVLSSLTAVDTASALVKLLLMSSPQTVVDRVRCITSQRLVRKICETCREKVSLSEAHREKLGLLPDDECYVGKGCEKCGRTGFQGFVPLFEIIPMTRDLKQSLLESPSVQTLRTLMLERGIVSLRDDGMKKVKQGLTTVQDVLKATML